MSQPTLTYLKGLLYTTGRITCAALARKLATGISHDQLSRVLKQAEKKGQTLLKHLALASFDKLKGGYLIIDDTVVEKFFAKRIANLAWVWSSKQNRAVLGLSLVVLCWSNGTVTIPIAFRLWQRDGQTKIALAVALLRYAKETLKLQPEYVLFDSYYSAKEVLRTVSDYHWKFVSQVKRNRLFNNQQVRRYRKNPYWSAQGNINGRLEVIIVRNGKKYFVTNDLSLSKQQLLALYILRWGIEEVFRFLHDQLGLDTCPARSDLAQKNHIRYCCMAYILILKEATTLNLSCYALKEKLSLERERYTFQTMKPFFQSA